MVIWGVVTTSSAEAELVAASAAAKDMMAARRLLNYLQIKLDEPLQLEIDNKQTIRLRVEESAKLTCQHQVAYSRQQLLLYCCLAGSDIITSI